MTRTTFMRRLRGMSDSDLDELENNLRAETGLIRRAKSQPHMLERENTSKLKNLRRDLARVLTIKNERRAKK